MLDYVYVFNYGYYFDVIKFVELLKNYCVDKLNVVYVVGYVDSVYFY